ncbi:MAG: ATP-binding protein [Nitrospirae bacterium]|nr:ATP-binding protein [Nitrospirota bacterium]
MPYALDLFRNNDDDKNKALKLINLADLQIVDIKTKTDTISLFDKSLKDDRKKFFDIYNNIQNNSTTTHYQFDKDLNNIGNIDLNLLDESEGTKKFIALLYYFVDITIETMNRKLIIDELDARLHPLIVNSIVRLFNENTKSNTQLIFTTHDTNLLDKRLLRRDQIWFTEKNKYGATDLYSLVEFKGKVRNDASYEKDYIVGRYGSVPFIGDFSSLLE